MNELSNSMSEALIVLTFSLDFSLHIWFLLSDYRLEMARAKAPGTPPESIFFFLTLTYSSEVFLSLINELTCTEDLSAMKAGWGFE